MISRSSIEDSRQNMATRAGFVGAPSPGLRLFLILAIFMGGIACIAIVAFAQADWFWVAVIFCVFSWIIWDQAIDVEDQQNDRFSFFGSSNAFRTPSEFPDKYIQTVMDRTLSARAVITQATVDDHFRYADAGHIRVFRVMTMLLEKVYPASQAVSIDLNLRDRKGFKVGSVLLNGAAIDSDNVKHFPDWNNIDQFDLLLTDKLTHLTFKIEFEANIIGGDVIDMRQPCLELTYRASFEGGVDHFDVRILFEENGGEIYSEDGYIWRITNPLLPNDSIFLHWHLKHQN